MKRHGRDNFYIVGEGVYTARRDEVSVRQDPTTVAALRKFRFSRLGPLGEPADDTQRQINEDVAVAMTTDVAADPDSDIPAGFTYLGQFVDHDLTLDKTAVHLGQDVTVAELLQGRSPALDLDSLYGLGPGRESRFYEPDGVRLRLGATIGVNFPPGDSVANSDQQGFDLLRSGQGSTPAERRAAVIPDLRNDENLAVAQTHLMFIKFHNAVVAKLVGDGTPSSLLFAEARESVVKHYQWMLRHDFLPRIVDEAIVDDVFTNGRRFFEIPMPYQDDDPDLYRKAYLKRPGPSRCYVRPGDTPTMPVEFSVAAFRFGHSMVRESYEWNRVFRTAGPGGPGLLDLLFRFSGTSGNLSPTGDINDPNSPGLERLPSNWIADFRRLFDFRDADRPDLVPADGINMAKRIDTLLVDPLGKLPLGAFGGRPELPGAVDRALNLAFRNLTRAGMVRLATGQQMAGLLEVEVLKPEDIINGSGGAVIPTSPDGQAGLTEGQKAFFAEHTPLWFYILREAELAGGKLTGVGGRIVAEVFHRAMEGSTHSIVRDPSWRPTFGPDPDTFRMVHLLLTAVQGVESSLFPLG
ncbi:heme peroxidase [Pseudonocardia sp. DSM 110487]|uniref:peroxidase family protein n=1 Tax=Pseudonocardia sp. DSM 110487 TaxID=2865833 RepID=UPI001C6A671D|nr:heme peroxidase family protein [Pseudonocardia sp. DSM 110487]QYN36498.1 heme peroxidase [Pseudonocardia sp. DSM 110487]